MFDLSEVLNISSLTVLFVLLKHWIFQYLVETRTKWFMSGVLLVGMVESTAPLQENNFLQVSR